MKIFTPAQIKEWDAFTIANEPISSLDLMERAAAACYRWLIKNNYAQNHFRVFCGKGNNGADGLAIARLLIQNNCRATVYILEFGKIGTDNFQSNLERLHQVSTDIHFIQSPEFFPAIEKEDIIIDTIIGCGLHKPLEGITELLVNHINSSNASIISIDMPTGLFSYKTSKNNTIIHAHHTLTFQNYKLAFLLPENENYCGEVHLLHIGLHPAFENNETADFELTDKDLIKTIYKPRSKFANKGTYGHAALLCGSYGMMGAAILSSHACLRSGAGKLTSFIPKCGYDILQTAVPEAMCFVAGEDYLLSAPEIEKCNAVGIGPGMGRYPSHKKLLTGIFEKVKTPMVIDADALNIIADHKTLLKAIPSSSIITPHPKEFDRLFGKPENDFERIELAQQKSKEHNIIIVLKGHFCFIGTPGDKGFFNSTGNAGMATAGSGDVLTGIITGLLAQGYTPLESALFGVYLHGLAGNYAETKYSTEAMIAGDLSTCLSDAFKQISA